MNKLFVITTIVFIIENIMLALAVLQIGFRVFHSPINWINLLVLAGLILSTMFAAGIIAFITVKGAYE